jgi:hypothetical protein
LQQTLGNRAVAQLLSQLSPVRSLVQAKLTVNAAGDGYEQEADRVAEEVMQESVVQRTGEENEDEAKGANFKDSYQSTVSGVEVGAIAMGPHAVADYWQKGEEKEEGDHAVAEYRRTGEENGAKFNITVSGEVGALAKVAEYWRTGEEAKGTNNFNITVSGVEVGALAIGPHAVAKYRRTGEEKEDEAKGANFNITVSRIGPHAVADYWRTGEDKGANFNITVSGGEVGAIAIGPHAVAEYWRTGEAKGANFVTAQVALGRQPGRSA